MMADVTNEPLLEHLKRVQDRMSRLGDGQEAIRNEIAAVKGHMASFMRSEQAQDLLITNLGRRPDRVERRLDLREAV